MSVKSVAVGYRSLQAAHDVVWVARKASERTMERLVSGLGGSAKAADIRRLIFDHGCRMSELEAEVLHSSLLLAATLPDDDPDAFRTATALLLADRLLRGAGKDDLFWHWDAFHTRYTELSASDRAAILQAFRQLDRDGLVDLYDAPTGDEMMTRPRQEVLANLPEDDAVGSALGDAIEGSGSGSAHLWAARGADILASRTDDARALLCAFRFLYEAHPDWSPFGETLFALDGEQPSLIPVTIE